MVWWLRVHAGGMDSIPDWGSSTCQHRAAKNERKRKSKDPGARLPGFKSLTWSLSSWLPWGEGLNFCVSVFPDAVCGLSQCVRSI